MSGNPATRPEDVPYYIRTGHTIVCPKKTCMHYGSHPNCLLPPMEREGECFYPKDLPSKAD